MAFRGLWIDSRFGKLDYAQSLLAKAAAAATAEGRSVDGKDQQDAGKCLVIMPTFGVSIIIVSYRIEKKLTLPDQLYSYPYVCQLVLIISFRKLSYVISVVYGEKKIWSGAE